MTIYARSAAACALAPLFASILSPGWAQTANVIYIEDFEADDGSYTWIEVPQIGIPPQPSFPWTWGTPIGATLSAAGQGDRCWFSDSAGLPTQAGKATLESRPIDLTQTGKDPVLQFRHAFWLSGSTDYRVEMSIDGAPFERLGTSPSPGSLNWYDSGDKTSWGSQSEGLGAPNHWWITSRHLLEGAAGHTVRIRWKGSWDSSWFNFQEGWALDDVRVEPELTDVALLDIQLPVSNSGLGFEDLGFTAKNIGLTHVSSLDVTLEVDGPIAGSITTNIPVNLAPDESATYSFPNVWDFGVEGTYVIKVTLDAPGDILEDNDSSEGVTSNLVPIDQFPYEIDFESGPGPFSATGQASSWEWGAPSSPYIGTAASGLSAWTTNLDGDFNPGELSYLWAPELDFTHHVGEFWLEFRHIFQLFGNCISKVEFSIDGGPFEVLGEYSSPGSLNWYNSDDVPPDGGWNYTLGTPGVWNLARHWLPGAAGHRVRVRFLFDGTGDPPYDQIWMFGAPSGSGVGIDDFAVRPIEFGIGQAAIPGVSSLSVGYFPETPDASPSGDVYGFPPSYGFPGPFFANAFGNIYLSLKGQPNEVFAVFTGDLAPASLSLAGIGQIDLANFELLGFGALAGGWNPFFVTDSDGAFELGLNSGTFGAKPLSFQAVTIAFDGTARLTNAVEVNFQPF